MFDLYAYVLLRYSVVKTPLNHELSLPQKVFGARLVLFHRIVEVLILFLLRPSNSFRYFLGHRPHRGAKYFDPLYGGRGATPYILYVTWHWLIINWSLFVDILVVICCFYLIN